MCVKEVLKENVFEGVVWFASLVVSFRENVCEFVVDEQ